MYWKVHKSHSRKDMIELIKLFKLPIEDVEDMNKKQVKNALLSVLETIKRIVPDDYYYGIHNVNELKEHLIKPNQKKQLSIKDKNEVIRVSKLVIQYCKAGFNVNLSFFNTMEDVYSEARRVSQYGDIPSIRRMCQLLNKNPYTDERVYPVMSLKTQNDLKVKKVTSQKYWRSLTIKNEKVVVRFD